MANGAPTVSNGLVISGVTTSTNVSVASSVTATTYYGSGANLTNITQTTINNNADNRVITGSGSANVLNAESNVHIDGSGRLMIGTTNEGDANADDLTIATTGHTGITLRSGTSNYGQIFFSDAESGTGEYEGIIAYDHSNNSMVFHTTRAERLRINSDGSYYFLGDSSNNTRLRLLSDGAITGGSGANDVSLEFASGQSNNMASEGAQLRYDNSNGKLHISTTYNSSDADIRFYTRTGALDSESNLRMNIMGDGYIMTPSQPSFRATKSGGPFNTGGGTVVFDQNQHNIGSNYNTSNGRFTAPVTGTYIFTYYSIYTGNSNNDLWDFRKNGSTFAGSRMHFTSGSVGGSWDNVVNTQIINLSANDYVEVYASDQGLHGGDWSHFCGHLLG